MIHFRLLIKSFRYALHGFYFAWRHEQNFRIQIFFATAVFILMILFRVRTIEAVALIGVMSLVIILELLNTMFERMVDILKPRIHHYASTIKDMMASAVLVASLSALIVGILIFLPYILRLF